METKPMIECEESIVKSWEQPEHTRLRIHPKPSDLAYVVFCDLNNFIKLFGTAENILILDFGAGNSPYKGYFPNADYRRADILKVPGLHYKIGVDSVIQEKPETFDLIISTQVLEHVQDTHAYLRESFRLLKKGGKLLVTTHGIWEEHGVPFDFQRWTESGMRRDLAAVGFGEIVVYKLTCGLRAAVFFFIQNLFASKAPPGQPTRILFKLFRTFISKIFPMLYRFLDKFWPEDKIQKVNLGSQSSPFYAVIAATAKKPI